MTAHARPGDTAPEPSATGYFRPRDLGAALDCLARGPRLILAGGTDVYPATGRQAPAGPILDLGAIDGLAGIGPVAGGLRVGAMTRWADIAAADLPAALAALRQAAAEVGGRQIQNAGTLGGNLCNASPAADGVPPLLTVDAEVDLASARGLRRVPLADFLTGPRQTLRRDDEVMTGVFIPEAALSGRSRFVKLGARRYLVISIAMVAVRLVVEGGRIATAALAVGACSATARRLPAVEAALLGAAPDRVAGLIDDARVAAALAPLDDIRASAGYRAAAAAELLRRAVATLATDGGAAR